MGLMIYEVPVGGGVLALSPMPNDIADITGWGAEAVVSMTEPAEMPDALATAMPRAEILWLRYPVVDYGVPTADWDVVERQILPILTSGGRVLIHCKGGCGRSGMAVLRLMIAAGEAPDVALKRLRDVRPCAIETEAQLSWATGASLP